jgi:alpha/beta hydrolase fold
MVSNAHAAKEVDVNGVRLHYIEQGSGEPIVFVHGTPHDLRAWEPVKEAIAKRYRFIAYSQRYFGTEPWPDKGKNFGVATHAGDLAKHGSGGDQTCQCMRAGEAVIPFALKRSPEMVNCRLQFPDTSGRFPVPRTIFPVIPSREILEKWPRHSSFRRG